MSAILCQKIFSYKGIKIKVSKLTFDTLFLLCSVEGALGLDFLHSIQFVEKILTLLQSLCAQISDDF